jgi:tetratricopeptide (TPR) repeat protein
MAAIAAAYWPLFRCDFLNFDDPSYVTENWVVQRGLTPHGLAWALTTGHTGNWHPLTWLSHMLDCQLFSLNPAAHHATNLLFHTLNSIVLFVLLKRMTGALGRSALVAALFALHPIHVESVAWVSERKDVLSTFFGLLAIGAYVRYVEKSKVQSLKAKVQDLRLDVQGSRLKVPGSRFPFSSSILHPPPTFCYALSLLLFAFSLMSKPMLVTLPFLLLLLDYWPLGRMKKDECRIMNEERKPSARRSFILHPSSFIFVDKLPFLALSIASSIITFVVQAKAGAVAELSALPLGPRCANAAVSYARYSGKILWPDNLAICYPRVSWGHCQVTGALLFVLAISLLAIWATARRPYLAVGWFWFLGTLVPVIGLIQVGAQSMADRYAYLPSIGIFIAVSWGAWDLLRGWPAWRLVLPAASACVLLALDWLTAGQLRYWRDSVSLFTHSLAVSGDDALNHIKLGESLMQQHRLAEAEPHFLSALRTRPQAASGAHYQLGVLRQAQGQPAKAIAHWQIALRSRPAWPPVMNNLAWLLATCRDPACRDPGEAVRLAERASTAEPENFSFYDTLGAAYAAVGRYPEAARADQTAIALAEKVGQTNAATRFRRRLELYQHQQPYREE